MTLEDQSGRVRLVGEIISKASVVTGVIIGALGMETPAGDFEVIDYCLPGLAPQRERKVAPNAMDIDGRSRGSTVSKVLKVVGHRCCTGLRRMDWSSLWV